MLEKGLGRVPEAKLKRKQGMILKKERGKRLRRRKKEVEDRRVEKRREGGLKVEGQCGGTQQKA